VRAVGYSSDRKGYINNTLLGIDGVNNDKIAGGRVSVRWLITDDATLDAMYLHQTTNTIGSAWYQPIFGAFNQANPTPTPWSESLDAYNAALNWKVAAGTVTATLSRLRRQINYQYPGSRILCTLFANPRATCFDYDNSVLEQYRSSAFQPQNRLITSSEVRYASAWSGPVQLVGGAFYENEDNNFLSTVYGQDSEFRILPTLPNIYGNRFVHNAVEQDALFGELTYNITHALSITGGFRVFKFQIGQRSQNLPTQTRAVAAPVVVTDSDEKSATYKGNIQYKFDAGPLVYFTYSQGFRSGGNNEPDFTTGTVLPPYKSDSLDSYELGAKGKFFHGAVEADIAIYDMEWKDLQQRISAGIPGSSVQLIANVGSARIQGGELGLNARPIPGFDLLLGASATVLKDVITQAAPGVNHVGDRVPNIPQFSTNVYADYGFPVFGWDGTARAEYQYVGDNFSDFNSTRPVYTRQGDYSLVNLRLSFAHDAYKAQLYLNNVFNTLGIITTSIDTRTPVEAFATRPRTVGAELSYSF
jgi:iron complex outermembrane recepter protein